MIPIIVRDGTGIPRHLAYPVAGAAGEGTAQAAAQAFLERDGGLLALPPRTLQSLSRTPSSVPEDELAGLRFASQKRVLDTIVVDYAQSFFGLPVVRAGVTVTLSHEPLAVQAATSTVHHDLSVERPNSAAVQRALAQIARPASAGARAEELGLGGLQDGLDETQREVRVHAARLAVCRYESRRRQGEPHATANEPTGLLEPSLPRVPLPPLPEPVRDGRFYVATETSFTMTTMPWGRLDWVVYVEVETGAVLQLVPLLDPWRPAPPGRSGSR